MLLLMFNDNITDEEVCEMTRKLYFSNIKNLQCHNFVGIMYFSEVFLDN